MAESTQILYDPNQFKEFGLEYYEGENFTIRYQYKEKYFWKSFYIPYGPNCTSLYGLDNFLKYILSKKPSRIRIDLPLVLDKKLEKEIQKKFLEKGFIQKAYIQDEETILITPEKASLNNKEIRYYVRKSENNYSFEVLNNLDESEINSIYEIYKESADRLGYTPKKIDVFHKLNENSLVGVAIDKESRSIHAFVWGYVYSLFSDFEKGETKKMLEVVFIGTNDISRKSYVGYGMHQKLFLTAFEEHGLDIINFRGASRTHDRKYLSFKKSFGGEFVNFAGSFEKINLI